MIKELKVEIEELLNNVDNMGILLDDKRSWDDIDKQEVIRMLDYLNGIKSSTNFIEHKVKEAYQYY